MRPQDETTDRGSALTMAIVFVTVIGLAMAIGLGYAATTLRATSKAYVPARAELYAANAAVKTAVVYTQTNPSEGRYTAPGSCSPLRTYGSVNGRAVTSQVCPRTSTSLVGGGGGGAFGLRTLAVGSEQGVQLSGQGGLTVNGNVAANSAIDVAASSRLDVNGGAVKAIGGCNQNVYVDGVLITGCTVPASPAPAVDPAFVHGMPTTLAAGSGTCVGSTKIATLQPGIWTQSLLDNAIGSCDYVQLTPGYHVLNDVSWTIKYRVVGGTLNGDITTSALGAGCVSGTSTGATVVLAGTSSIALSGPTATLEICGQTVAQGSNPSVRLPLYGLTAALVGPTTSATMTNSGGPSQTTTPSGTDWLNISRAQVVDTNSLASVSLAASGQTEELRIPGFAATPAVPSSVTQLTVTVFGSSNRSATFTVVGRNSSGTQVCGTAANPTTAGVSGAFPSSYAGTAVTLTCSPSTPAPLTIGIVATAGSSPNQPRAVSVDGASVSFLRPGSVLAPAQSGCIIQAGGCSALSTSGNSNRIYLEGELYMPLAKVDVQLPNASGAFTTRGVTVRVFKVATPASIVTVPIVATDYGVSGNGDVVVNVSIGGTAYMSCRVTFASNGSTITSSAITACTSPR